MNLSIAEFQQKFGKSIRTPLLIGEGGSQVQAEHYDRQLLEMIEVAPKLGMSSKDRLAIYNQQYWFRLITVFQEEYPCTLELMGLDSFNELIIAYLHVHPSLSPTLRNLSNKFVPWLVLKSVPHIIIKAAELDGIYIELFDAPSAPVSEKATEIHFSPILKLFKDSDQLVERRIKNNPGENISSEEKYWAIYRDASYIIQVEQLSRDQFTILRECECGASLSQALENSSQQLIVEDISPHLSAWFMHWRQLKWL